jgi:hypothetical protein
LEETVKAHKILHAEFLEALEGAGKMGKILEWFLEKGVSGLDVG